jgi:hypothetical protein
MRTHFDKLFDVEIYHHFHESRVNEEFTVIPTRQCARELRDRGLLFRTTRGGFGLFYQAFEDEQRHPHPVNPIDDRVRFSFLLQAKNPLLSNYSEPPMADPRWYVYRLTNLNDNCHDGELLLSAKTDSRFVSSDDLVQVKPLAFPFEWLSDKQAITVEVREDFPRDGPVALVFKKTIRVNEGTAVCTVDLRRHGPGLFSLFVDDVQKHRFYGSDEIPDIGASAVLDLFRHEDVPSGYQFTDPEHNHDARGPTYTVRIKNRETRWRYRVVLKYRRDLSPEKLSVVHRDNAVAFARGPTEERTDGTKVVPFVSEGRLPFQDKPVEGLELRRADTNDIDKAEIENLPNPSVRSLTTVEDEYYSDVFVYL